MRRNKMAKRKTVKQEALEAKKEIKDVLKAVYRQTVKRACVKSQNLVGMALCAPLGLAKKMDKLGKKLKKKKL